MNSQCADCGEEIQGNHAVRDGERYCPDCKPLLSESSTDVTPPETVDEYLATKRTIVPTAAIMNGGEVR